MLQTATDKTANILIIDDETANLEALSKVIEREGLRAVAARSAEEGLKLFSSMEVNLVITDLKMAGKDGFEVLREVKRRNPNIEVIVVTAHGTIEKAVAAMREGAYDFIAKPFERLQITRQIQKALEKQNLLRENLQLKRELEAFKSSKAILGQSRPMQTLLEQIRQAGATDSTVLLLGESGTGKELAAAALHRASKRADRPFIIVSCTTIPENLLEAELFGYEKGAFTGAVGRREGRFEIADRGTLFLDEVGDMPLALQGKLLRVLQEGCFERLGSNKTQKVDVRIIAATNRDLQAAVGAGRFREDLFYRLNVIPITMPSLRERRDDIPLLVQHFIRLYGAKLGKSLTGIAKDALQRLVSNDWPGNVRQLEHAIERAVVFAKGPLLTTDDFGEVQDLPATEMGGEALFGFGRSLQIAVGTPLAEVERRLIDATLRQTGGDKAKTAKMLGVALRTIYRKTDKK